MKTEIEKIIPLVKQWNRESCLNYLAQNYGLRGVSGKGITKLTENRTLPNMRKEVINQMTYIMTGQYTEY